MSTVKKLFITADDFGYCPQRNAGIIQCFTSGAITDTSILANSIYAKEAAESGLEHNLPMGLHFNVSEGKPVSNVHEIPSLVDGLGQFYGKLETMAAAEEGKLEVDHMRTELRAQIEKFKTLTGYYPRRIDGHQHVHVFPTIREAFAQVLKEYNITLARVPRDLSLDACDWMAPEFKKFSQTVSKYADESLELFSSCGIRSSEAFIGCSLMNFNSTNNFTLDHIQRVMTTVINGTASVSIELMVHPGYPNTTADGGCGVGPDNFSKDIGRQWEMESLGSTELGDYFKKEGLKLQSWECDG